MGTTPTRVEPPADGLIKARREGGRFVNSFNPQFKKPSLPTVLRWALGAPNNTRLPREPERLDELLPVIKHRKEEIFQEPSGLRFLWIGHASCLVQMDDFIFLTDPLFGDRCGATPKIGPKRFRPPALTVNDLPDNLQVVVISHNHFDHLDYPSVRALNQRFGKNLTWFCGDGNRQWFLDAGIANVFELTWWQTWQHPVGDPLGQIFSLDHLLLSFRPRLMFTSPSVLLSIGSCCPLLVLNYISSLGRDELCSMRIRLFGVAMRSGTNTTNSTLLVILATHTE